MLQKNIPAIAMLVVAAAVLNILSMHASTFFEFAEKTPAGEYVGMFYFVVLALVCYIAYRATKDSDVPTVLALLVLGWSARGLLHDLVTNQATLKYLVGFPVVLLLYRAGMETDFGKFRLLMWRIVSLAFFGVIITAFLESWFVAVFGPALGYTVSITTAVLLGLTVAPTDPGAVLAFLEGKPYKQANKDIAITESALNDGVGATAYFLVKELLEQNGAPESVSSAFMLLFTANAAWMLFLQMGIGLVFGLLGFAVLHYRSARRKKKGNSDSGVDAYLFLVVPYGAFLGSMLLDGSGFVAAFLASLFLGQLTHMHKTESHLKWLEDMVAKPTIFTVLGAIVDVGALWRFAPIGIAAGLFMVIARFIAVAVSLLWWMRPWATDRMMLSEVSFVTAVTARGAVPAVLLVDLQSGRFKDPVLLAIGMWTILVSLVLTPILMALSARLPGVLEEPADKKKVPQLRVAA